MQRKLVESGRGGYCFEQNLLFQQVLRQLGFCIRGLAARVLWNARDQQPVPRTHMLLLVEVEEQQYIADVGFGGLTLTAPLLLEPNRVQQTSHEPFRLIQEPEGSYLLQVRLREQWRTLYRFDLQEQFLPDYEVVNWYVSCHPGSRFVNNLVAARPVAGKRYALLNNALTVHHLNGEQESSVLTHGPQLREVLQELFGLVLPHDPALTQCLERTAAQVSQR